MKLKRLHLILLMILAFLIAGCSSTVKQSGVTSMDEIKITKHPIQMNFYRDTLNSLPSYNPNSQDGWQVDLRSYNLSSLELKDRINDLMYADFDSKTIWPKSMPDSFDPQRIMELGKSPGLGVEELHKEGVTGKGIGIAIIDQKLLVDHIEYKDNLKLYEEIHCLEDTAQIHGPAVASIAIGKTTGVAPQADLYYIAETHGNYNGNSFEWDFTWLAKSIDRILEVNKLLSKDKKIRVISISVGWGENQKGYNEVVAAVERAKKQGIFVVSSSLFETYGYTFNGLGRNPLKNPEDKSSYEPGLFWARSYYKNYEDVYSKIEELPGIKNVKPLLIPMDSRTTASPTGNNDYVFYRSGGWSWSIPYIAGLYALTCQVKPDITPDIFLAKAIETGDTVKIQNNGREYDLKSVVNPVRLIEDIKK